MRVLDYLFAARPLLHLPVWSIYLVSLHYHIELSGGSLQLEHLLMLVLLSAASAGAYYINQVFDEPGDFVNRKLGFLHNGLLSARALQIGFIVLSSIALVGAGLISRQMLAVFGQLVLLGYLYSAPPFRLKDRPVWGLVANAYGFGALIVVTVMPDIGFHNAGLLGWDNPFYFMAAVGSVFVLTTIPDAEGDRATGKRTIAVEMGTRPSLALALLLDLVAAYAAWHSGYAILFYLAAIAAFAILAAFMSPRPQTILLAAKLPILLLTILAGYFFPIYLLFIVALIFLTRIYYSKRFEIVYPRLT